ncbi:EAL and HDOD domain-containing protein [Sporosarcina sp. CAU 1771]
MKIFVGRQPILDLDGKIFGYELLYRNSETNSFPGINPEKATIELLVNTFLSIGVNEVVGEGLSFINFTGKLLAQEVFDSLDPERVIIEILEDVEITPALLTRISRLKETGFKIALDDFILQGEYLLNERLFQVVDYIKVDFVGTSIAERTDVEKFSRKYPQIQLLAEKIETKEQYNIAKEAGYKLFQGYYFAKPEIMIGYEIPSYVNMHFIIIQMINKGQSSITEIADLIMRDVSLSYKLLRFINSPAVGVRSKVSSIRQALVLVGLNDTKKWMHVLAMREINQDGANGSIRALVEFSLIRAKTCELLARKKGKDNPDEYFMAGMLSLMNVIMKSEWDHVLKLISVSDRVANTLQGTRTSITPYIEIAEAIERFDWERLDKLAVEHGITMDELSSISTEAFRWTRNLE